MVIKSKTWKTIQFKNLLNYMLKEEEKQDGKFGFLITHNIKGETAEEWDKQFKLNEKRRIRKRIDSVILTHYIISFSPEDSQHLTPEILKDITEQFIQERGIHGMYVAVPHYKQDDHMHIHICASGIEYLSGKTMRQTKSDFAKLKTNLQEYQKQKYPLLSNSIVEHGKVEKERTMKRKEIIELLRSHLKNNGEVKDEEAFKKLGAKVYYRNGRKEGISFRGKNYRYHIILPKTYDRLNKIKSIRVNQTNSREV